MVSSLDWFIDQYNNVLYPLNYPFKICSFIDNFGVEGIIVNMHTSDGLKPVLKIFGNDCVNIFTKIDLSPMKDLKLGYEL